MNLESFKILAAHAAREQVPELDVTAGVLRRIRAARPQRELEMPWLIFSGVSLAAAAVVLMVAVQSWAPLVDPLSGLFDPLTMVIQ
jgi:hypothetical protein